MKRRHLLTPVVVVGFALCSLCAENKFDLPVRKVEVSKIPKPTDAPNGPIFGPVMCDESGSIYFRYFPAGTSGSSLRGGLAKISNTGHYTAIEPGKIPDMPESVEVLFYTIANDGKIYEVLHPYSEDAKGPLPSYLAVFSSEGTFISSHQLQMLVYPNFVVPLPSGDVFMGGTLVEGKREGLSREPFLGIFSTDGSLKYRIKRPNVISSKERDPKEVSVDPEIHGGMARLGLDGNIYLLLASTPPRVKVLNGQGQLLREFNLQSPLKQAFAVDLFVSGGRLLAPLYGRDINGKKGGVMVVYNAESGAPISAFEAPEHSGRPACWQDGRYYRFLVVSPSTGQFAVASAEVQ